MAQTRYPFLTDRVNTSETLGTPNVYVTTADGGAGGSFAFGANDDWEIVSEISALPTVGGMNMGLSSTKAERDDINGVDSLYVIGIGSSGDVDFRSPTGTQTSNAFANPALAAGDAWALKKIGKCIVVKSRQAGTWRVIHVFPTPVTTDLYLFIRSFNAGATFGPTVTYGATQAKLVDQSTNVAAAGNSLVVRDDGGHGTVFDQMMLRAPFLGSRSKFTNCGVDGQTTVEMGSGAPRAAVAAAFDPTRARNVLFIWEITNDIAPSAGNQTPTNAAAHLATAIANFLLDNPWTDIVVLKTIPRQGGYSDGAPLTQINDDLVAADDLVELNRVTYQITRIVDTRAGIFGLVQPPWFDADFALAAAGYYDGSPNRLHEAQFGIEETADLTIGEAVQLGLPTVTLTPDITAQPVAITVIEGDVASFSVTATASAGTLSYQWKKRGVDIGGNSNTLTLPVYAADTGAPITVVVSDSNGSVTSAAVTLGVRVRRPVYGRRRVSSTYDYSAAGWFDVQMVAAGLFDHDMISTAAAGPIAALTATEANDTVVSAATSAEVVSLTITEANDTLASAATEASAAALTAIEAIDTLVSATALAVNVAFAATEASDTLVSATTVAGAASLAVTEAGDTLVAAATSAETATLAVSEANDTLVSAATSAAVAALTGTEANDALVSAATAASTGLNAALAVTEANDALASAATEALASALTATEAGDTLASAGASAEAASLAATEANDTVVSATTSAPGASLTVTEADDVLASTATEALAAALISTGANDTLASAATEALAGALVATEGADSLVSAGALALTATLTVTESADSLSADVVTSAGTYLSVTEANDLLVAASTASEAASLAATEADDTLVAAGAAASVAALIATETSDLLFAQAAVQSLVDAALAEADDTLNAHATTATSGGGGATPEEVWNYVLSNGLTAGETLAQALAHATNCCG